MHLKKVCEKSVIFNPGSGHGLLPDGTRPQSQPMLTQLLSVPCSAILMDMYKIMLMKNCSIRFSYLTLNMLNCFLNIIKTLITCHIISWDLFNRKIQIHHEATLYVNHPILSISCLLLSWWLCEPGHQQAWYWQKKKKKSRSIPSLAAEEFMFWSNP